MADVVEDWREVLRKAVPKPGQKWAVTRADLQALLDEIDRLRNVKPAPTRYDVEAALQGYPSPGYANDVIDQLARCGLLAELLRAPNWYWVKRTKGEPYEAARWQGGQWFARTWQGDVVPFAVGPAIEPPPDA